MTLYKTGWTDWYQPPDVTLDYGWLAGSLNPTVRYGTGTSSDTISFQGFSDPQAVFDQMLDYQRTGFVASVSDMSDRPFTPTDVGMGSSLAFTDSYMATYLGGGGQVGMYGHTNAVSDPDPGLFGSSGYYNISGSIASAVYVGAFDFDQLFTMVNNVRGTVGNDTFFNVPPNVVGIADVEWGHRLYTNPQGPEKYNASSRLLSLSLEVSVPVTGADYPWSLTFWRCDNPWEMSGSISITRFDISSHAAWWHQHDAPVLTLPITTTGTITHDLPVGTTMPDFPALGDRFDPIVLHQGRTWNPRWYVQHDGLVSGAVTKTITYAAGDHFNRQIADIPYITRAIAVFRPSRVRVRYYRDEIPPLRLTNRDDYTGKRPSPRLIKVNTRNNGSSLQAQKGNRVGDTANVWW